MEQDMPQTMNEESEEKTPLDSIISRVKSYSENPAMVTKETLGELLGELEDLKSYVDGDDMPEKEMGDMGESEGEDGKPSLVIAIGKHMKKGKEGY